ncbi:MAG: putative DNA binding domain-containing protein [Desulfobacterales bacterium]|nr:putative DNA binding domain-containing protein [Desulfobacterales bacterium]
MLEEMTLEDLAVMAESVDLECKAAQGRDGRGELPHDVWKSYCAMANTDGGTILLGVQEKPAGVFKAVGISNVERVRKALWDNLHNRQVVNLNLLSESNVQPIVVNGKTLLRIEVPRARRQQRPVYLGDNPFSGTYVRRHESDYLADDETVRRLIAEQVEDSRDDLVLKGFDFTDLDMDSITAYRNRFSAVKPGHVWLDLPLREFLESVGALGRNRDDGYSGLRLAGLLMFGRAEVIHDAVPNYMVDYQERPEAKAEKRWVDRLVPDGTWSGNIYDFYRKVYQKLTADLKVPFQLQDGQRIDDTPVHEALREALVNTLIHADYSGRVSVLVVKRPDMFGFRNPGRMRIPPAIAILGSNSDCRNRRLQTLFQLVGYGDHAGSGLPKIYRNWQGQHWRRPLLYEQTDPEQTLIELRMTSLIPDEALAELESHLGDDFRQLPELGRLALVTAVSEGMVNHARLREISTDHPADITKMLGRLVKDDLLVPDGVGRGMVYFAPWMPRPVTREAFSTELTVSPSAKPSEFDRKGQELDDQGQELTPKRQELEPKRQESGLPIWTDRDQIPDDEWTSLQSIALPVKERGKVPTDTMQDVIRQLCQDCYVGLRLLSLLLGRNEEHLRNRVLNKMVSTQLLRRAFPRPNDPRQAYTSNQHPDEQKPKA